MEIEPEIPDLGNDCSALWDDTDGSMNLASVSIVWVARIPYIRCTRAIEEWGIDCGKEPPNLEELWSR